MRFFRSSWPPGTARQLGRLTGRYAAIARKKRYSSGRNADSLAENCMIRSVPMTKLLLLVILAIISLPPVSAKGRASGSSSSRPAYRTATPRASTARRPPAKCYSCKRASTGRIHRSSSARTTFQKSNPCPSTGKTTGGCKGHVIDHVRPLKRGGADSPENMQWQSTAAAKAKDRVE